MQTNIKQVRLDFTEDRLKSLDDLQRRANLTSRKDLFNEALSVYARFLQIIEEGGSLPYADTHSGIQKEIAAPSYLEVYERVQRELKGPKTGT